jgi:hypothetical protein
MKTSTRIIATIVSFLILAGVSPASAQDRNMTARVPFEFVIADTTLPRDIYDVSRVDGSGDVLLVRGARQAVFVLGQGIGSEGGAEMPRLVFHRYANQYFLREIEFSRGVGLSLPETSQERDAAEQRADRSDADAPTVAIVAQLE